MPVPTPFHARTSKHCTSMRWKEWAGYFAVCSYDTCHEREYYALRHGVGMIDVTPLFKYDVRGPDAGRFLARVTVRDMTKLRLGRVSYCCWCDDQGKVIDDGTVTRMGRDWFRVTSAEPSWAWFHRFSGGFDVAIEDVSTQVAALSLQGPTSRGLLMACCGEKIGKLKFFRMMRTQMGGFEAIVTRTGYTGDLGYEIWVAQSDALALWDLLIKEGAAFGLEPCGLDAMDVTRIEAGFVMNGVDYFSAHHCLLESRKSNPYEMGLGWTVQLDRAPFNGQKALLDAKNQPAQWVFAGLEVVWDDYEELCASYGLPPQVSSAAWRDGVPIYASGNRQIGYATCGAWSPILKKSLALATVKADYGGLGSTVHMEVTVEYTRHKVRAKVVPTPFYNPPRKRS